MTKRKNRHPRPPQRLSDSTPRDDSVDAPEEVQPEALAEGASVIVAGSDVDAASLLVLNHAESVLPLDAAPAAT